MESIKKNKKGFLLGESTAKVLIAVLCIFLLVFLLYGIYGSFNSESNLKKAEATLSRIIEGVDIALKGPEFFHVLIEPEGWVVLFFAAGDGPEKCGGSDCLCVCKKPCAFPWICKSQKEKCDKNTDGVCKKVFGEGIKIKGGKIEIDEPVNIGIKRNGGGVLIYEK
jgi:hypothetical protein